MPREPIKRIQRNARQSDSYNDGSAVIPTGPEQSGPVTNAMTERCGSRTDAAHGRMRMEREKMHAKSVHKADTVSLLRARACTLRAKYHRMWRSASNGPVQDFKFTSPEVVGADAERIEILRRNNREHGLRLDSLHASMNPDARKRWERTSKCANKKFVMWEVRDDAVWNELERRKDEVYEHPPGPIVVNTSAGAVSSASGSSACDNTARAVYSSKFYDAVGRIQHEIDEEDVGIVKPSRGECLLVNRTPSLIPAFLAQIPFTWYGSNRANCSGSRR